MTNIESMRMDFDTCIIKIELQENGTWFCQNLDKSSGGSITTIRNDFVSAREWMGEYAEVEALEGYR